MTRRLSSIRAAVLRLKRDDEGAALVEFAIILPMIFLIFAVMIEGSRLFWSYQATIAGVHDATRYLGRSVQTNICANGASLADWSTTLEAIVRETSTGNSLFPASITVSSVDATLECFTGDFRMFETPVATVTAVLNISYPFESLFNLVGIDLPSRTTTVTDSSRIFGA